MATDLLDPGLQGLQEGLDGLVLRIHGPEDARGSGPLETAAALAVAADLLGWCEGASDRLFHADTRERGCQLLTLWGARALRTVLTALVDHHEVLTEALVHWLRAQVLPRLLPEEGRAECAHGDLVYLLVQSLVQRVTAAPAAATKRRRVTPSPQTSTRGARKPAARRRHC